MLKIPAHAYEHGREKVEGDALMVACAEGGAAVACAEFAEFESGSASKTLSKAALGAVASSQQSAAAHEPTAHRGDVRCLIS